MAGISSSALKGSSYPENRKKYNGNEVQSKEFSDGSGLEWFDFNARTYDQQLGRFMQIDPWIEVGTQEMLTPYQFSGNNPIRYNDPDGKCPWCVGALIGGLVDAGLQLTEIALTDKPLSEFSVKSVLVSAAAGALSSGISSIAKIKQASTIVKIGVELATDAGVSAGSQLANDGQVSLKKTFVDVVAGQVVGRAAGALVEKKVANSAAAGQLKEAINREKNIARGKSNTVSKVKAKVTDAEKKLDQYVNTRAAGSAATASGAASKLEEFLEQTAIKEQKAKEKKND
jgi:RHS repeat-associated protein